MCSNGFRNALRRISLRLLGMSSERHPSKIGARDANRSLLLYLLFSPLAFSKVLTSGDTTYSISINLTNAARQPGIEEWDTFENMVSTRVLGTLGRSFDLPCSFVYKLEYALMQ